MELRKCVALGLLCLATFAFVPSVWAEADSDLDGLPDTWEISCFGGLGESASGDPDGDGRTNVQEFADGTVPTDAGSTWGLTAYYALNGDALDSSGNGRDGTVYGGIGYVPGVEMEGGLFDGTDDYIRIPEDVFGAETEGFAFAAWLSSDVALETYGNYPIYKSPLMGEALLSVTTDGHYRFTIRLADGSWHGLGCPVPASAQVFSHVVGVYRQGTMELYQDGSLVSQRTVPDLPLFTADYGLFSALGTYNGTRGFWDGRMDEVRIYDRALDPVEVFMLAGGEPSSVVSNTADSGPGSLRNAIAFASANPGPDVIEFAIPSGSVIGLQTDLPTLMDNGTTIDGDLDGDGAPDIVLDGNWQAVQGIRIRSAENTIRGLVIHSFTSSAVQIYGAGAHHNTVSRCFIGTDLTGTQALGNGDVGPLTSAINVSTYACDNYIIENTVATQRAANNDSKGILVIWFAERNQILRNWIGTNESGDVGLGIQGDALKLHNASNNYAAGNVLSGNGRWGVFLQGQWGESADRNTIENNLIGLAPDGTTPLPNGLHGIYSHGGVGQTLVQGNRISHNQWEAVQFMASSVAGDGGPTGLVFRQNVISRNEGRGILLRDAEEVVLEGNVIEGNAVTGDGAGVMFERCGQVTVSGNTFMENTASGWGGAIRIVSSNQVRIEGNRFERNVAQDGSAIAVHQSDAVISDNVFSDNAVTVSYDGAISVQWGSTVEVSGNDITDTSPDAIAVWEGAVVEITGNRLSGMTRSGIRLKGCLARVHGNEITGVTGAGILCTKALSGTTIYENLIADCAGSGALFTAAGGLDTPYVGLYAADIYANTITANGLGGIVVADPTVVTLSRNAIYANGGLGIDLGDDGVTPNDSGDADSGPNGLQNFPVLQEAHAATGALLVRGVLAVPSPQTCTIELFGSSAADDSGYGEGQTYLANGVPGADGSFALSLVADLPPNTWLSATATDASGNTSEFSLSIQAEFSDTDLDGLPDAWEIDCFGDLDEPATGDPDGDGRSNIQELGDGTDPTDPGRTLGLIAYYALNGDALDSSGNGQDGTAHGELEYTPVTEQEGGLFDGVDDYVRIPEDIFGPDIEEFTFSAWLSSDASDETYAQFAIYKSPVMGQVLLGVTPSGGYNFVTRLADGSWHGVGGATAASAQVLSHVVGVYRRGSMEFYQDGRLVSRRTIPDLSLFTAPSATAFSGLGANSGSYGLWEGRMDEVRIYDRALGAAEVFTLAGGYPSCVVENTNDSGPGSLRNAIGFANVSPGPDTIVFQIPTTDPGYDGIAYAIRPLSPLPALTDDATAIDGDLDADTVPDVVLDGSALTSWYAALRIRASHVLVRGLSVCGFPSNGLTIEGTGSSHNTIEGCYVGLAPDGAQAPGNGSLAYNYTNGIYVGTGTDNTIRGNVVVRQKAVFNGVGITVGNSQPVRTTLTGNWVGTDQHGTEGLGNGTGIKLYYTSGNTVEGNVVAGNGYFGIFLQDIHSITTDGNTLAGNLIGLAPDGVTPLPNGYAGIGLSGPVTNTFISGNHIAHGMREGVGIYQSGGVSGPDAVILHGNRIEHNARGGVSIIGGTRVTLEDNVIHGNGGLGIDLGSDGITPNDPGDVDSGTNGLQNYPVVSLARTGWGILLLAGVLDTQIPETCTLEVFSNDLPDDSGHGEGQICLGSGTPNADGSFELSLNVAVPPGAWVSATATDALGNTSEFSLSVQAIADATPPVAVIDQISPASSCVMGELVTFRGHSEPQVQSIALYEWSITKLDGELAGGTPLVIGAGPELMTDELPVGEWRVQFRVQNTFGVWSAPDTRDFVVHAAAGLTDLAIYRSSIRLLNAAGQPVWNPSPGDSVKVEVEIRNESLVAVPDTVQLSVYQGDMLPENLIGQALVEFSPDAVSAKGTVLWQTSPTGGGYTVLSARVEYAGNVGAEPPLPFPEATLQNNTATCTVLVGSPAPGQYAMDTTLHGPTTAYPGDSLRYFGDVHYDWGSRLPVMGAAVQLGMAGGTQTTTWTTAPEGRYTATVSAPPDPGDYLVTVSAFDGVLYGEATRVVHVVPRPEPQPSQPADPDLLVAAIEFGGDGAYTTATGGRRGLVQENLTIRALVRNRSGSPVDDVSVLRFRIGEDLLAFGSVPPIPANGSVWVDCASQWQPVVCGIFTVFATADDEGLIAEQNEYNNTFGQSIAICERLPDLQPVNLRLEPANPVQGDQVAISCDVRNNGPGELLAGDLFDVVIRSVDPADPAAPGIEVARARMCGPTPAGGVVDHIEATLDTALLPPGRHSLLVEVDLPQPGEVVEDLEQADNTASVSFLLHDAVADLSPIDLRCSNPQPSPGETVTLIATIRNDGGVASDGADPVTFAVCDTGQVIPPSPVVLSPVAPRGGTQSISIPWTAPEGASARCVRVEVNGRVFHRVLTSSPDLAVRADSIQYSPNPPLPGAALAVSAEVTNLSAQATAVNFLVAFYADGPYSGLCPLGPAQVVASLGPQETVVVNAPTTLSVVEPYYALLVRVTPSSAQNEADWSNNEATTSFELMSANPGVPDLLPESDTGVSDQDNITRLDNASPGNALRFQVPDTIPGATVTIHMDGTPVGYATAEGMVTIVQTTGTRDMPDGPHAITATQRELGQSESAASPSLAMVVDTAVPAIELASGLAVPEGAAFISQGYFTDPGGTSWAGRVNYGDGDERDLPLAPDGTFQLSHAYGDDGTVAVIVTVADAAGNVAAAELGVAVTNAAPIVMAGEDQTLDEGAPMAVVATWVDPGWLDSHTAVIEWGDGAVESMNVSELQVATSGEAPGISGIVAGSHAYGDNGLYTVTVHVADDDGTTASDSFTATVLNVAPVAEVEAIHAPIPDFILPGDALVFTGTFTDVGWLDTHEPVWTFDGDPSTQKAGLVVTHAFDEPGVHCVEFTVTDDDGGTHTTVPSMVDVLNQQEAVEAVGDTVAVLPADAFVKNPSQRLKALGNILAEAEALIASGDDEEAIEVLLAVLAKMDGTLEGGNPNNDWVADSAAQELLSGLIVRLIKSLGDQGDGASRIILDDDQVTVYELAFAVRDPAMVPFLLSDEIVALVGPGLAQCAPGADPVAAISELISALQADPTSPYDPLRLAPLGSAACSVERDIWATTSPTATGASALVFVDLAATVFVDTASYKTDLSLVLEDSAGTPTAAQVLLTRAQLRSLNPFRSYLIIPKALMPLSSPLAPQDTFKFEAEAGWPRVGHNATGHLLVE